MVQSFGQEFYPHDAIRALRLAEKWTATGRHELVEAIAARLPQASGATRHRIASKFVQRYVTGTRRELAPPPHCQPFVRLVARQRHTPTQLELLYLYLAKTDTVVGAIASELFYPVCIAGRPPEGYSAAAFAAQNGGQLFMVSPLLTRGFVLHYAKTRWRFGDHATVDRSLRILQSAGLVARERMADLRGHPTAFRLSRHDVSLVTFVYALYDEFLPHLRGGTTLVPGVLPISDFARTLLLDPAQVAAHCEAARRHQLLAGHGDQLRLVFGSLYVLVDHLLTSAL